MPLLDLIERAIGAVCRWVLYLTLSVVFVVLSVNVGLRYIAGTSLSSASELPELMFPWMIMSGVVLAAQHGAHIAVVVFTQKLGASRRWVLAGGALVVATLYGTLAALAWPLAQLAADERTPMLQVPGSISVYCLMLGFALLTIVTLCQLPRIWAGTDADTTPDAAPHGA